MLREWYIREALEKKKTVKKHTPDKIVLFYHETARLLKSAWFWLGRLHFYELTGTTISITISGTTITGSFLTFNWILPLWSEHTSIKIMFVQTLWVFPCFKDMIPPNSHFLRKYPSPSSDWTVLRVSASFRTEFSLLWRKSAQSATHLHIFLHSVCYICTVSYICTASFSFALWSAWREASGGLWSMAACKVQDSAQLGWLFFTRSPACLVGWGQVCSIVSIVVSSLDNALLIDLVGASFQASKHAEILTFLTLGIIKISMK